MLEREGFQVLKNVILMHSCGMQVRRRRDRRLLKVLLHLQFALLMGLGCKVLVKRVIGHVLRLIRKDHLVLHQLLRAKHLARD